MVKRDMEKKFQDINMTKAKNYINSCMWRSLN